MSGFAAILLASLSFIVIAGGTAAAAPRPAAYGAGGGVSTTQDEPLVSGQPYRDSVYVAGAAGCGQVCDYKDPASYRIYHSGCASCYHYCADDAETVRTAPVAGGGTVELRYSPRCRTAWARTAASAGAAIKVESYYVSGSHRATAQTVTTTNINYSAMLDDAGLLARACRYVGFSGWYCTGKY